MPLLVDEIADFISQTLETIWDVLLMLTWQTMAGYLTHPFTHSRIVAHRFAIIYLIQIILKGLREGLHELEHVDGCSPEKLPSRLHPTYSMYAIDGTSPVTPRCRPDVSHVRYYSHTLVYRASSL